MKNVQIPLNAYINTKDNYIIHNIEGQEKDVLDKKNTLEFQSTLSPLYTKSANKRMLTSGKTLSVEAGQTNNNVRVEPENISIPIDHIETKLYKTIDLSNNSHGKCTSFTHLTSTPTDAIVYAWEGHDKLFISYEDVYKEVSLPAPAPEIWGPVISKHIKVVGDYAVMAENYKFSGTGNLYTRTAIFKIDITVPTEQTPANITTTRVDNNTGLVQNTFCEDLYVYINKDKTILFTGFDSKDARKRQFVAYEIVTQLRLEQRFSRSWFGCIGDNGLVTGEPIPMRYYYEANGTKYKVEKFNIRKRFNFGNAQHPIYATEGFPSSRMTELENGVCAVRTVSSDHADADIMTENAKLKDDENYKGSTSSHYQVSDREVGWTWVCGYNLETCELDSNNTLTYGYFMPLIVSPYIRKLNISESSPIYGTAPWENPNGRNKKYIDAEFVSQTPSTSADQTEGSIFVANNSHVDFTQVDFSDGFGNLEWDDSNATISKGCNPFPYTYYIFNRPESRGVYWDYGPGWAKSYIRSGRVSSTLGAEVPDSKYYFAEFWPAAIISYGLSSPESVASGRFPDSKDFSVRIERLSPFIVGNRTIDDYDLYPDEEHPSGYSRDWNSLARLGFVQGRYHTFNKTIFEKGMNWTEMVGADNMPNHSVLNKLPFNVDIVKGEGSNVPLIRHQYYQGQYLSTSINDTLITSPSVQTNTPSSVKYDYDRIYILDNNSLFIFQTRQNTTDMKFRKVSDYLFATDYLIRNKLIVDSNGKITFEKGFIPYNGEEILYPQNLEFPLGSDNEDLDGNDTYFTACGYNVQMNDMNKRSTSFLLPAAEIPLVVRGEDAEDFDFQLMTNKKELTKPFIRNVFDYKDDVVDHYYTHAKKSTSITYQVSHKMEYYSEGEEEQNYGVKTYDINKEGQTWWITKDIQIFPLGFATQLTGVNYLSSSIDMSDDYSVRLYRTQNVTFPVYNPESEVYRSSTIFTIYGYNYSFDGQAIYYLGSGDDTTASQFTCYALGMKFLANSGTEAYFYSDFEKRLYIFTGSVTLQSSDSLAREGEIIDSLFSSSEQILYLLMSDGKLIMKSQSDMCIIEDIPTTKRLESTETGAILVDGNSYAKYRLNRTDETEWVPLDYQTEYIGKNDSLFKIGSVEITFFKGTDVSDIKGVFSFDCMNDKLKVNEKIPFNITKKDWDESQLVKVKITPKNNVLKAFKFGIKSDDYYHIANVNILLDEVSDNTNAQKRY